MTPASIMNELVIIIVLELKLNGLIKAIKPKITVASTITVPKISPSAKPSSFFLTARIEKKNSGKQVPILTAIRPIRMEGKFRSFAKPTENFTVKNAAAIRTSMLIVRKNNELELDTLFVWLYFLENILLSLYSVMKKKIPAIINIAPSILEKFPSTPKSNGKAKKSKYKNSRLTIFDLTLIPVPENKAIKPKIKLKSVTLDPNKVPRPKLGLPFNEDIIATAASGSTEIIETIIKETRKLDT